MQDSLITKGSFHFQVSSHDTDYNGCARPSCILRYMQEAALSEFNRAGFPIERQREEGSVFILSRVAFRIFRPLRAWEELIAESWACPSSHASFLRCAQIRSGEEQVAAMTSVWALIHLPDRRLMRVNELSLPFGEEDALQLDLPARLRLPVGCEEDAGTKTICYGDVDVNRHMNNTNYPDMICGALPSMDGRYVTGMMIDYLQEAALGETIHVYRIPSEDGYYVKTIGENGRVGIASRVWTEEINE